MSLKAKATWMAAAIAGLLAMFALVRVASVREPSYHGRTLREWIGDPTAWSAGSNRRKPLTPKEAPRGSRLLSLSDVPVLQALQAMGANAIPVLVEELQVHDSVCRLWWNHYLAGKLPMNPWPLIKSGERKAAATDALIFLAPQAQSALPKLQELLGKKQSAPFAARVLIFLGPEGLGTVTNALRTGDSKTKVQMIQGMRLLQSFGSNKSNSGWGMVRHLSPQELTGITDAVVPCLADCLLDKDPEVQMYAAHVLGEIGDPRAAPALVAALRIKNGQVQALVTAALMKIDPAAATKAGVK